MPNFVARLRLYEQKVIMEMVSLKHLDSLGCCRTLTNVAGMYSSGSRLSDSIEVAGRGLGPTEFDLPEYMCGGAQQRQRASTLRYVRSILEYLIIAYCSHCRRAPRQNGSLTRTTKRRKAGTRVTSKYAFEGEGQALNAHISSEAQKKKGAGFRKSTQRYAGLPKCGLY